MKRKRKKIEKKRGTRTCGRGGKRKARGKGNRGGHGYSGSKKHRKTYILKYEPDHLGKRGFIPKSFRCTRVVKAINLRDLDKLIGDKEEVNLSELGFDKVIGAGGLTKKVVIRAKAFSAKAKEKIEELGGKAIEE
ncbi:MAG: uL15 family ribosomal protein [Candidatus Aenigmatarchaeota archaeon]